MENKKSKKKIIIISSIIGFLVLLATIISIIIINRPDDEPDDTNGTYQYNNDSGKKSNEKKEQPKELTESEKMITKIVALMDEKLAFDTGDYIQGDIPKGEYAFVNFNGDGTYYCEKDASGSILDNEHFDSFGYVKVHEAGDLETDGVLISITAFESLGVSGAKEIYEILTEKENYNQSGYYKVGNDIDPGDYILESIGSEGYYSKNSGPVSGGKIINNDFVDGKASVNLKNGQYIEISRLTITKK